MARVTFKGQNLLKRLISTFNFDLPTTLNKCVRVYLSMDSTRDGGMLMKLLSRYPGHIISLFFRN